MRKPTASHLSRESPSRSRGFTLTEVLLAAAIGLALMSAIASVFIMSARMLYKNEQIDSAVTNSRYVQEHLNGEMSVAISQTSPVVIRPEFADSSGTTPARYARMTYRVPVGSFATVAETVDNVDSSVIKIDCPSDIVPMAGDYFLMDEPSLGLGILIQSVSGPDGSGIYTLTLAKTIREGSQEPDKSNGVKPESAKLARIQRERRYETVDPTALTPPKAAGSPTELRWYPSVADTSTYQVLSKNVDSAGTGRFLFAQVPDGASAVEPAISWRFPYKTTDTGNRVAGGSNPDYYQTSYTEGLIMPKSGNPLSTASIIGGPPQSSTTTIGFTTTLASTSTAGTTTAGTTTAGTTTAGTTTAGTTTRGTTTRGTTTRGTTTAGTTTAGSTTSAGTTTRGTTTRGTTTAGTTTRGTTTLGTTTRGTSTAGSTTTAGTTTRGTTTRGTTTRGTTTAGTTTRGTTTRGTTTAGSTTTAGTTTAGTTTRGTTTSGTTTRGTTTVGTTTAGTTTAGTTTRGTTTTKATTTTIPFDG